jgi:hypothetical protein
MFNPYDYHAPKQKYCERCRRTTRHIIDRQLCWADEYCPTEYESFEVCEPCNREIRSRTAKRIEHPLIIILEPKR